MAVLAAPAVLALRVARVRRAALLAVPRVAHRVRLPLVALLLWLLAKAHRAVPAVRSVVVVLVLVVLAGVPVLARLVVEPAVPVQPLLSSRSSSAAMARNTT